MLIDDLTQQLITAGLGTLGTDVFSGFMPGNVDNGLVVIETGGLQPDKDILIHTPTFQVLIRSKSYSNGRTKLTNVYNTFHQLENVTLGGTYFFFILAQTEGGHIGRDDNGRDQFSINFHCKTK